MERDKVAFDPTTWTEVATGGSGTVTATKAAATRRCHLVHFVIVSADAAPGSALTILVKDGSTTKITAYMPAAATAPVVINLVRPLRISENSAAVVTAATVSGCNVAITMGGNTVVS